MFLAASVLSVPAAERPSFQMLRYNEDWSFLRDPALHADAFDPLKFIPFASDGGSYLTLGADIRERYEYFHHSLWGQGPQDRDGYLLQRYMVHADAHFGESFRIFTQFKSGLETDRNGGPRPTDRDDLDLHQLFFDATASFSAEISVTLRAGRQELAYGSSRLISVRESPNVRQSFDGIKAIAQWTSWQVDAFAVKPVETKRGLFDDGPDPERNFWGVYAVTPVSLLPDGHVDLYYLGLERDRAEFDQGTAHELRHSIGTRIWGEKAGWDYNVEVVYQFGSFGRGDIRAWTAASDFGYTVSDWPLQPRFGLKADITSGDHDPSDPDLQTFNPLFPRGAYFSETALIGPANHIDVHPSAELHLSESITATVDWDFFWRESTRDGIYGNAVNLVRTGQTSDARYVGNQCQGLLEWKATPHLTITAAYAHFFAGEFLKESGPGKDVDYASAWLTYRF